VLLFHQKNWFRLLESNKAESFPGKDFVYRFLNHTKFAWRQFLLSLSAATIQKVGLLTSDNRVTAFIFDDSMLIVTAVKPWNCSQGSEITLPELITKAFAC
jgi:hypothetical protein